MQTDRNPDGVGLTRKEVYSGEERVKDIADGDSKFPELRSAVSFLNGECARSLR